MKQKTDIQAHIERLTREYNLCIEQARVYTLAGRHSDAQDALGRAYNKSDLIFCLETGDMSAEDVKGL